MNITPNKKRFTLITSLILLTVVMVVGLFFWQQQGNQSKDASQLSTKPKQLSNKQYLAKTYQKFDRPTVPKTACDFFDESLAKQTIGPTATRDEKVTALQGLDYNSTICEYVSGTTKATVTVYRHPNKSKVAATLKNVKSEQNVVKSKNEYVVAASVVVGDKFDTQKSDKVLDRVQAKL